MVYAETREASLIASRPGHDIRSFRETSQHGGYTLMCAFHNWRFDVRTETFLDVPEISVPTYAVKSEPGKLFVSFD